LPTTINVPANEEVYADVLKPEVRNTLKPEIQIGKPIVHLQDAEANVCASVALGPSLFISLTNSDIPTFLAQLSGRLDLPKISLCASQETSKHSYYQSFKSFPEFSHHYVLTQPLPRFFST
jgi:hypothetical protein